MTRGTMKKTKEYKALKQIVHNDLGFNKAVVDGIIEAYIEKRLEHIAKKILDSNDFERRVDEMIATKIKDPNSRWHSYRSWLGLRTTNLDALINDKVSSAIEKLASEKINVSIRMKEEKS